MSTVETIQSDDAAGADTTGPMAIVSCDSHIGPRIGDLRQYCPREHLESFDEFRAGHEAMIDAIVNGGGMSFGASDATNDEAKCVERVVPVHVRAVPSYRRAPRHGRSAPRYGP